MDSKKLLADLRKEQKTRRAHSMWLEAALVKEFTAACEKEGFKAPIILERLMREFIDGLPKKPS